MKKIKVRITEDKHILSITPETTTIGAQYDNESQCLEFERPLEFADTDLIPYFGDSRVLPGEQAPEPVNLGAANEWVLMSDLTRCQKLQLQIAFRKNGTELTHSNVITLELRPSISPEPAPAASLPERLATLEASAFTGMAFENSTLTMTTATGGEEKVTVTGGDASFSIPEAPTDNKLYGRRNEEWEEVTGGAAPE